MSTFASAIAPEPQAVRVRAYGNDDAEITILDGFLNVAAHGVGEATAKLPQGLCMVRANRGGAISEQIVDLAQLPTSGDAKYVYAHISDFPAIAPIGPLLGGGSWDALAQLGDSVRQPTDEPSLLIMMHEDAATASRNLLAGMRVYRWGATAKQISIGKGASSARVGDRQWSAAWLPVETGTYVLEYDGLIRQAILVAPEWETRVFIRRNLEAGTVTVNGDLRERLGLSIQMARSRSSVVYSDHEETIEVARNALAAVRPIFVSSWLIEKLLHNKWENPIMGMVGLHLFLSGVEQRADPTITPSIQIETDLFNRREGIIDEVLKNLSKLLSTSTAPDLVALRARAGRLTDSDQVIGEPPMFWASWEALRRGVGAGHEAAVERRLWNSIALAAPSGPYLSWKRGRTNVEKYVEDRLPTQTPLRTGDVVLKAMTGYGPFLAGVSTNGAAAAVVSGGPEAFVAPRRQDGRSAAEKAKLRHALGIPRFRGRN